MPTGRYFIFVFLLDFEAHQHGGILFLLKNLIENQK
jgi:hypothetical protein